MILRSSSFIPAALIAALFLVSTTAFGQASRREQVEKQRQLLRRVVTFVQAGSLDSAEVYLDEMEALDPSNPDVVFQKARLAAARGDTAQAVSILQAGIDQGLRAPRLRIYLARLKIELGELEGAEEALNFVLMMRPHDGESLYLMGMIHLARGDTTAALDSWEKAMASRQRKGRSGRS